MIAYESWGLALVHFLWQGTFVAIALLFVLRMLSGRRPEVRYSAGVAALVVMMLFPFATLGVLEMRGSDDAAELSEGASAPAIATAPEGLPSPEGPTSTDVSGSGGDVSAESPGVAGTATAAGSGPGLSWRIRATVRPLLPWIVPAWALGVLFLSIRLGGGWLSLRRLTRLEASRVPDAVRDTARELARRLSVSRPVRLVRSAQVAVPAVIGWARPVILLPVSALTGLTPTQLEAIIAHELAHIRRHDYLVNLFQTVVETLLFYHPAVWWVSRRIREEREHCCDDLAVSVCGDRRGYARALLDLETLVGLDPQLAVAAGGGSLVTRVRRLILPPASAEMVPRGSAALATASIGVAVALLCGGNQLFASTEQTAFVFIGEAFEHRVFRYEVSERGGVLSGGEITANVNQPGGIAFGPDGEMFVSNRAGSIARFRDPEGSATPNGLITAAATGAPFGQPHLLDFHDGELLVAQGSGTVLRFEFDPEGNAVFKGALQAGFETRGVEANPVTGEVFVSNIENSIYRFELDGAGDVAGVETMPGSGTQPHGMVFTPWGELLVADFYGDLVARYTFDETGAPIPNGVISGGDMTGPVDLDFSPWGELFVTNHNQSPGKITRWRFSSPDASGTAVYQGYFEIDGNPGGIQFSRPRGSR